MSKVSWLFGTLQEYGVDTKGMDLDTAFAELEKLRKSGKITDDEINVRKNHQAEQSGKDEKKKLPKKKVVKVDMDAEVQKQLDAAETPKERQNIAFRYIMDNLRGKYAATDGRTVAIERVGADKMTYQDNKIKLRVCPSLADMIKSGEFQYTRKAEEKKNQKFEEFAYYRVRLKVGNERYVGLLNVGIRADGSSTLYDLKPLLKEDKKGDK